MRISLATLVEGKTYTFDAAFTDEDTLELLESSLAEPMRVQVQYTMVQDVTYLRITVEGKVHARCDMCGEACVAPCSCQVDEELTVDSDCYDSSADEYDIAPLVDQAIILSAPRKALCRVDCKGLCPTCGKNLNTGTCTCQQDKPQIGENNPFGVLLDIFPTGGANNGSTKM